jgi:hypothetical protein
VYSRNASNIPIVAKIAPVTKRVDAATLRHFANRLRLQCARRLLWL